MNRVIEATGKTVKDAVAKGLEQLGCTIDEVEYTVLDIGKAGLFGMFGKPAKISMTVKAEDPSLDIEMPELSLNAPTKKAEKKAEKKPEKKAEPKKEAKIEEAPADEAEETEGAAEEAAEKPAKSRRRRSRGGRGKGDKQSRQEEKPVREYSETVAAPAELEEPFEATPEEELTDEAKNAREFLKELTQRMGVPAEIAVALGEDRLRMELSGENMSILIGRRGETLDAIQYLTSLNVNRGREEYLRVTLDTENYRAKREEALRKLAVRMANRAKKSGRRVALEPMNPNERRILHSALQNDPDVTTHSEGEEPYRRVIITLK